jgi:hypothetical protein
MREMLPAASSTMATIGSQIGPSESEVGHDLGSSGSMDLHARVE